MHNEDDNQDTEIIQSEEDKNQQVNEFLENAPPELKAMLRISRFSSGPMPNPLAEKMDGDHLHKIIDNEEKESGRDFKREIINVGITVFFVLVFIALVVYLSFYFKEDKVMFLNVLIPLVTFLAGGGTGYGICSSRKKSYD